MIERLAGRCRERYDPDAGPFVFRRLIRIRRLTVAASRSRAIPRAALSLHFIRRRARRPLFALLLASFAVARPARAQDRTPRAEPPTDSELAATPLHGRQLATFDWLSWHASDALLALHPVRARVNQYLPRRTEDGWLIAFGRLTAAKDSFLVAYEARLANGDSIFRMTTYDVPKVDTGYFLCAARAIEIARADFGPVQRPYNVAAIPDDSSATANWRVYLYPAPTVADVWPLGADERYVVSHDGGTILERLRMHKAIIEYHASPDVETYTHAAILDDVPEDTDVYIVLTRTPRAPEVMVTEAFLYRIELDGSIEYLGRRKEVLGSDTTHQRR